MESAIPTEKAATSAEAAVARYQATSFRSASHSQASESYRNQPAPSAESTGMRLRRVGASGGAAKGGGDEVAEPESLRAWPSTYALSRNPRLARNARGGEREGESSCPRRNLRGHEVPSFPRSRHRAEPEVSGSCAAGPGLGSLARGRSIGQRDVAAPADAELRPKRVAVRLRRSGLDAEARRDLLVGAAFCDQADDLKLSFREHPPTLLVVLVAILAAGLEWRNASAGVFRDYAFRRRRAAALGRYAGGA